MQGGGFEPPKAEPAGLQPAPFGHSGIPAGTPDCSRAPCLHSGRAEVRRPRRGGRSGGLGHRYAPRSRRRAGVPVDRASFPRDKPCGGGLTGRALKQMPVDPSPVVERDVDRFELRLRYGRSFVRSHAEPLIRMTQRRRLDAFLAEEAAAAGAAFRDGTAVGEIELDETGVRRSSAVSASRPMSSSERTVRTVSLSGRSGSRADRSRRCARGQRPPGVAADRSRTDRGRRARNGSRWLRLGVSEGGSRQPRRRRVGERGPSAPGAPRAYSLVLTASSRTC